MIKVCENCKNEFETSRKREKYITSKETKKKISLANKGNKMLSESLKKAWRDKNSTFNNIDFRKRRREGQIGRKFSKETREKISKSQMGRVISKETKRKISKSVIKWLKENGHPFKGKKHSQKSRKQMSEKLKGRIISEETKKKLSIANTGKKRMKKERLRISKMNSGKNHPMYGKENKWGKHSEESKEKIKIARSRQIMPMKDTKIEVKIQNFLKELHIGFFTHCYMSNITHGYQCDILIPVQKNRERFIQQPIIIECDGCFWHNCPICKTKEYEWTKKMKDLDELRTKELTEKGFRVIRLWGHEIKEMELGDFEFFLR